MRELKNPFANHILFWAVVLPMVMLAILPAFLPRAYFEINPQEVSLAKQWADIRSVNVSVNAHFTAWFIDTSFVDRSIDFFSTNPLASFSSNAANANFSFTSNWIQNVWLMVYRSIWRIFAFWPVIGYAILGVVVPFALDGAVSRSKKKYEFGFQNPVYFYSAMHIFSFCIGMAIFLPMLPMAINYEVLGVFIAALALASWVTAGNFQVGAG
ncbi:DUF4400 domain-containing protein [Polynucleobacter sp. JS-Safj-400b-B2]|uniref:DUF4400 domain-containing protein n=1 Tax=Polynucleobacter sp. JS-Safj-400b-B2 TaxID=2576921 RepID=UPI001C0C0B67|nr:DUF4400 domain-containing protein [Polynucleobacter sp. JS-Safj-400b-B2]MBU3625892.1 DUF4400 domain-containing protein [Polynucleobacter sp. JS-Safj-400b-B2]